MNVDTSGFYTRQIAARLDSALNDVMPADLTDPVQKRATVTALEATRDRLNFWLGIAGNHATPAQRASASPASDIMRQVLEQKTPRVIPDATSHK